MLFTDKNRNCFPADEAICLNIEDIRQGRADEDDKKGK